METSGKHRFEIIACASNELRVFTSTGWLICKPPRRAKFGTRDNPQLAPYLTLLGLMLSLHY